MVQRRLSPTKYPSHTELYKDIHLIEDEILRYIFKVFRWPWEEHGLFFSTTTKYEVSLEEYGWDVVYLITKTPSRELKKLRSALLEDTKGVFLFIEYKSSIHEWGKQVDSFMRQIKTRVRKTPLGFYILMSFDKRFEEYSEAMKRAGIPLVILPEEILNKMQR